MGKVRVIQESDSGRNEQFMDIVSGIQMNRVQFVNAIKIGIYKNYHIRKINGVDTPCSNPNGNVKDNLG